MDKPKFELMVNIDGKDINVDYNADLVLDESTIDENLKTQPSLYAWYSMLADLLSKDTEDAEMIMEITEATRYEKIRSDCPDKLTEKRLEMLVINDEECIKAKLAYQKAKYLHSLAKSLVKSFEHRKDMLVTLAANLRSQRINADMYVKDRV